MKHFPLPSALFTENRRRFIKEMKGGSIAIFNSNDEMPSNADATYNFVQNSDLYWLTGIQQEDTMLLLFPDHPDPAWKEVLVLIRPNELKEKWIGHRLTVAEGQLISGIKTVIWLDELDTYLAGLIHMAENIYLNTNEHDKGAVGVPTRDYRFIRQMKQRYPLHQYLRSAQIIRRLRSVKTPYEVEVIQKAIDITDKTFRRLLAFIEPGVYEYEIEAEILHEFLRNRASGEAYPSIIASGDRARILHYIDNNQKCESGELVLMDFGARYGGYNADLTRTVPVNGKFTKRQKELYNGCLDLHRYCASILKPGITLDKYHEKVGEQATTIFIKLGLLSKADVKNEDPNSKAYRKYLYHGISHHLGVDVHDLGDRHVPLKAGAVLTIEPGIYIPEEQTGIRIEDNYLLTRSGNKDLMKNIPITAEEIEKFMKRK
ncbi:aminopeptidase P family protein [Arachidicoccus terrestris]|uniref:aminopeptidase P family protein n=1 Tax=Arachidicoccus terrestris TaxID=2875539 RepID=UPI001CC800E0|nr:aminopeptidase P family protein [Arachidicoccus terrestris]UAY54033.1 aminopeptidase P N-terminal domain-containing protein [Arachidicoccus terrestris]